MCSTLRVGHPRAETTPPRRDSVLQNQTWTGWHHITTCADISLLTTELDIRTPTSYE